MQNEKAVHMSEITLHKSFLSPSIHIMRVYICNMYFLGVCWLPIFFAVANF